MSEATTQPTGTAKKKTKKALSHGFVAELGDGGKRFGAIEHLGDSPFGPTHVVSRYRMANGLTILVLVDPSAPVFSYQTWMNVGSRHEKRGKTGLAHLFEHLMFGETSNLPKGAFDRALEEAGAESNAATWLDWTFYYENLPKDRLAVVVKLEADRLANLILREPQVVSEKEVVSNERRLRVEDDVDGAVNEILFKLAFEKHAYGWPTIGWMEDIQGFTTDDCAAFYRTYYAPNNATVIVVGDVSPRQLLAKMQATYGDLPPSTIPIEDVVPEPPQTSERRLEVKKPTATEKIAMGYKSPALGDESHAALAVVNEILFGGRASRMHRALVQDEEIALEVRGWVGAFRDPSLYEITMTGRTGVTGEQLLAAFDAVIAKLVSEPVGEAELAKVKARLELAALSGMEAAAGKAEQIGFWELLAGNPNGAFARLEALRRVTVTDVRRAARRFLVPEGRSIVFVRPDGSDEAAGESDEVDA